MQLVVVSPPGPVAEEGSLISEMLALGLARFHVRKPGLSVNQLADYLDVIPKIYHSHVVLHSHHALVGELGLGGVHLTAARRSARTPLPALRPGQTLSTSFHTLAEIRQHRRPYDYVFLSPIFDSLSKEQYPAAFDLAEVAALLAQLRLRPGYSPQVMALGGIEAPRLAAVRQAGFTGAAVLGAVWQSPNPVAAFRALQSIVG